MNQTPDYERFAHEWGNGQTATKIAIGAEYDEQLTARFKSLDWEDTHCTYEPDYQFDSGREGAWAVDISSIDLVRERTGLGIPLPQNCAINPRPFADGSSAIETRSIGISELSRECLYCEADGVLSAFEYNRVYNSARGLRSELLLDSAAEPTHMCSSCEYLFVVPTDERSEMAKAMGEPA